MNILIYSYPQIIFYQEMQSYLYGLTVYEETKRKKKQLCAGIN